MNKQRGVIAVGWLLLAGALALIGSSYALLHLWQSYITSVQTTAYDNGKKAMDDEYKARDNKQLQEVIAAKDAAAERAAQLEEGMRAEQLAVLQQYNQGVKDGTDKTNAHLAALRAGALILRDPGSQAGASQPCRNPTGPSQTSTTGPINDGAGTSELSKASSGFLLTESDHADRVVRKLTACQARVLMDLKVCNAP
jgi:hypothetical protein